MALNTNIALGVQPIQQQPNMLAQYAQVMGIKAAQQEMQGNDELRAVYSQGGDLSDPAFRKRVMAANPQLGSKLVNQFSEMSARDVKTQADSLKTIKDSIGMARSPTEMAEFLKGAYSTPGGALLAKLVPLDKALASIPADPKGFADYQKNFSLSADKLFTSAADELAAKTRIQAANIGAGATMRGQDITDKRLREQMAFEQQKRNVIAGEGQFLQTDAYGNVYPVAQYGATRGPNAPAPAMPTAAANAFITSAQPSVNALAPTAPPQGAGPTVAAASAMDAQNNIPRPKQPIRQPVPVMKDGKSVLVSPQEAVGMQPATAFNEKTAEDKAKVSRDLETAIRNLEQVVKPGGLLEKSTGSGFGRMVDASAGFFGQSTEGAVAGAQLAPIADMVLKMVPRFEGPQSNKDVDSYLAAAGKLADTGLPNDVRAGAAKVILKLMKERKDQFVIKGQENGGGASGGSSSDPLGLR
jgi:hypothetical protein